MNKLTCALVLAVFGSSCGLTWAMLTLLFEVKKAGRVLPYFTGVCISLRPLLIALPCAAVAYYLCLWLRKEPRASRWIAFILTTMAILLIFVLPAISTSYLLLIDQVKLAVGAR